MDDDNDRQFTWAPIQSPGNTFHFTGATLDKVDWPQDYTMCAAYMFKAFTFRRKGHLFYAVEIYSADTYTDFNTGSYGESLTLRVDYVLFPFTWTRVCQSIDTVTGIFRFVVNGEVLYDKVHKEHERNVTSRGAPWGRGTGNYTIRLGQGGKGGTIGTIELPGSITQLNVFSSALTTARMVALTEANNEECGAPGDYVSWEEEDWQLYSNARLEMVDELDGPCMGHSEVTVYTADFQYHSIATNIGKHSAVTSEAELSGCMEHCQKVGNGRSPPVRTQEEWDWMVKEVNAITSPDIRVLKDWIWVAATDEEVEGEWRDAYPPYDLLNTTEHLYKDWANTVNKNCLQWSLEVRGLIRHWCQALSPTGDTNPACLKGVIKIKDYIHFSYYLS